MLDRNLIRRDPEAVKAGAKRKNMNVDASVDAWIMADSDWRALSVDLQAKQAEMNQISKSIGMLMGQGKKDKAEAAKAQTKDLKEAIGEGESKNRDLEARMRDLELGFPNIPHESVPDGTSEADNRIVREWGEQPKFAETPQP